MKIYLASVSARRKQLLRAMGVAFKTLKPVYDEKNDAHRSPAKLVKEHALGKALSVLPQVKSGRILSADSIVYCQKKIIGKPRDKKEAFSILNQLQGRWQMVFTGVAILDIKNGRVTKKIVFIEKTRIKLKKLSRPEILNYIEKTNPYDKAGGFGIQDKKFPVLEDIRGSLSNAVGLPVERLIRFVVK